MALTLICQRAPNALKLTGSRSNQTCSRTTQGVRVSGILATPSSTQCSFGHRSYSRSPHKRTIQYRERRKSLSTGATDPNDDTPKQTEELSDPAEEQELWPWEKSAAESNDKDLTTEPEEKRDLLIPIAVVLSYTLLGSIMVAGTDFDYLRSLVQDLLGNPDQTDVNSLSYFDF